MFEEIIRCINEIGELHIKFSEIFFSNHISYHLKKTTIDKVIDEHSYDIAFISLIDEYIEELATFQLFNTFQSYHPQIVARFRGKNKESALNKLYHYRFNHCDPKIPLQKSLNDLLGFRLILDTDFDYNQLLDEIKQSPDIKIELFRPYVREKDEDYQGIHLYFKSGNNHYFPWELQIWKKKDEISNENSHRKHKEKRKYICWTEIYSINNYADDKKRKE